MNKVSYYIILIKDATTREQSFLVVNKEEELEFMAYSQPEMKRVWFKGLSLIHI